MRYHAFFAALASMVLLLAMPASTREQNAINLFRQDAASRNCMKCHEKFYTPWSYSRHGSCLHPYSSDFAQTKLTLQAGEIAIGKYRYRADISSGSGWIEEASKEKIKRYKIGQVLSGKNIFCFLSPFERGRHQVLPLAYDIPSGEWFDLKKRGYSHFSRGQGRDAPGRQDSEYTFTTECYRCHVNPLSTGYDLKNQAYQKAIESPGISCEACHGPVTLHEKMMMDIPPGQIPPDPKVLKWKDYTPAQKNDTCASCHARTVKLTRAYQPGDRFLDHFSPITLDDPDFFPDGRGGGECLTYISSRMSSCFKSGKLSCDACHTPGGQYRHGVAGKANEACLPCHERQVVGSKYHTHHKEGSEGSMCVSCHMPSMKAGSGRYTDHSMLPPTPAASVAFKAPNACSICHADKDAAWADKFARQWWKKDYQLPLLHRAGLIDAARKADWARLPEMASYILSKDRDEVFAASLLRMMKSCSDELVQSTALKASGDPSPLVRSAAIEAFGQHPSRDSVRVLIDATGDDCRLVRIRAAEALANTKGVLFMEGETNKVEKAMLEYTAFLTARPDSWLSYYNLGDYLINSGNAKGAMDAYEKALKLQPYSVAVLVNLSMASAQTGNSKEAEKYLQKALKIDPFNATANFNMGLLRIEQKDLKRAQKHLRAALKADPEMADAAFNLGVIIFRENPLESLKWLRTASSLKPKLPKYAYTLAYYTLQKGDVMEGVRLLKELIDEQPQYMNAYVLLGDEYEKQGRREEAQAVYRRGAAEERLPQPARSYLENRLKSLSGSGQLP